LPPAVADRPPEAGTVALRFPADCALAVATVHRRLPRAGLRIENRTLRPVGVAIEARGAPPRAELGTVRPGETRVFAHALPAGRNVLVGMDDTHPPRHFRGVVYVENHGPATCEYRYLWRIG
jgi:hypothetical protein